MSIIWCKKKQYQVSSEWCEQRCPRARCPQKPKLRLFRLNIGGTLFIGKTTKGELKEIEIEDIKNPKKEEVDGFVVIYQIKNAFKPTMRVALETTSDEEDKPKKNGTRTRKSKVQPPD